MTQAQPTDPNPPYNRADYVGLLVRLDIPGTLDYLDACGETGMAEALRRKLSSPEPFATGEATLDAILNAYQTYFQTCFTPADQTLEALEQSARATLTVQLGEILNQPGADLDPLEETAKAAFEAAGWHYLGGTTRSHYGPYIWQETTRTDYAVEIPSGTETVTVFWMDGFLMRSWLDWLSDGEVGAGGWAKDEGLYCVRKVYAGQLDQPSFQISFLKHEAQHHADFKRGELESWLLEYRAKLVELIYYPDSSFLKSLLASGDLASKGNSHAYAAGKIAADLSAWLEAQGAADGMRALEAATADEEKWEELQGVIRKGSRELLKGKGIN
ncbi:MAG: hypothetical protein H0S79_24190 [Anaerolineaceae bacterium]|nr:hypothetical protein [Anaerolineaceae bacterium]